MKTDEQIQYIKWVGKVGRLGNKTITTGFYSQKNKGSAVPQEQLNLDDIVWK